VRAQWHFAIGEVYEANLIEDTGARLDAQRDSFTFDLKPYEIRTFKVTVPQAPNRLKSPGSGH
jgi:hypothetical protein